MNEKKIQFCLKSTLHSTKFIDNKQLKKVYAYTHGIYG